VTALVVAGAAAIVTVLCLARVRRAFLVVVVAGSSMWPAYRPGDRVLVRRAAAHRIRRGQVVVLRYPDRAGRRSPRSTGSVPDRPLWIIKRAVALPGDPYPVPASPGPRVPVGWLAVHGDNAAASDDSRKFGLVPAGSVLGTVVRRMTWAGSSDLSQRT
jgi:signal peptidase I